LCLYAFLSLSHFVMSPAVNPNSSVSTCCSWWGLHNLFIRRNLGSISSTIHKQLLCTQIPKAQKNTVKLSVFFCSSGICAHKSCSLNVGEIDFLRKGNWFVTLVNLTWYHYSLRLHHKTKLNNFFKELRGIIQYWSSLSILLLSFWSLFC